MGTLKPSCSTSSPKHRATVLASGAHSAHHSWPITFDYPANWVLIDDHDDVNIECSSVTRLAAGGAWLTFERGHLAPYGAGPAARSDTSFNEPYWFIRRTPDDWRVNAFGCAERNKRRALSG